MSEKTEEEARRARCYLKRFFELGGELIVNDLIFFSESNGANSSPDARAYLSQIPVEDRDALVRAARDLAPPQPPNGQAKLPQDWGPDWRVLFDE